MDRQELLSIYSILQLVYHRNKNQHQRAKWWKWLAMLKRATSELASAKNEATHAQRRHLANNIIPKCYVAFSSVVADNQFATLGVALLATLARLAKAIGFNHELRMQARQIANEPSVAVAIEDRGERVQRVNANSDTSLSTGQSDPQKASGQDAPKRKSGKKSSKRKKNAIDDLFSGLL